MKYAVVFGIEGKGKENFYGAYLRLPDRATKKISQLLEAENYGELHSLLKREIKRYLKEARKFSTDGKIYLRLEDGRRDWFNPSEIKEIIPTKLLKVDESPYVYVSNEETILDSHSNATPVVKFSSDFSPKKRQIVDVADTLLGQFYLQELLSDDVLETLENEDGISPDSIGEFTVATLPSYARESLLKLAESIYDEVKKNGYAYSFAFVDSPDNVLFVKTKDGIESVFLVGDLQRDSDDVRVIADRTLDDLEDLYRRADSEGVRKAIIEEAKNWIDKTPYAKVVAPTLYEMLNPEVEENHDLDLGNDDDLGYNP